MALTTPTIGVLALQGAFEVHARRLAEFGATTCLVRRPEQLAALDASFGFHASGESTALVLIAVTASGSAGMISCSHSISQDAIQ